jgi:ubiquitin-conjugating enzyme E2 J2
MANISKICMKRLAGDIKMLHKDPLEFIEARPDDKDFLTWYFLVKGPDFSDYKGGYYIGKIMHNPEYPFKPPDFMMLTPNGRFMDGHKICLSNSSYHSSEWSALWNIKSILTGFLSIMLDDVDNGISHIHSSKEERAYLAKTSIEYNKVHYSNIIKTFTRFLDEK